MIIVNTSAQAKYFYDRQSDVILSAWIRNEKKYENIAISGVP